MGDRPPRVWPLPCTTGIWVQIQRAPSPCCIPDSPSGPATQPKPPLQQLSSAPALHRHLLLLPHLRSQKWVIGEGGSSSRTPVVALNPASGLRTHPDCSLEPSLPALPHLLLPLHPLPLHPQQFLLPPPQLRSPPPVGTRRGSSVKKAICLHLSSPLMARGIGKAQRMGQGGWEESEGRWDPAPYR